MISLLLLSCTTTLPDPISPGDGEYAVDPSGEIAPAARADLRIKRWRQLQLDLEGALLLPPDEVCKETGLYDCTDLHVVPMGGVSVTNGLYRSVDTLSATTGLGPCDRSRSGRRTCPTRWGPDRRRRSDRCPVGCLR